MSTHQSNPQTETSDIHPQVIKVLQEVSSALVGTFEPEDLLQKVVETFRTVSKASACSIFLIDEGKHTLVMEYGVGYNEDLTRKAEYDLSVDPNTPKIGLTAWIALTKQKFSSKSRQELTSHPAWRGKYDGEQYTGDKECKSFIGVPLVVRNKVIGVLKAENKIPDREHPEPYFTPQEERNFEILANTAAMAIENVRLITEQRQGIVESIHKVSAAVVGTFELDEILQRIVETFKEISNATACSIFLVDDDKRHIRMRAGVGYEKDLRYQADYDLTVDPNALRIGLTAWILLTKQKFSAKTRSQLINHPAWRGKYDGQQYAGDERCESFIGVPLIVRDEVIGVLKAENKRSNSVHQEPFFTLEEEQIFEILSNIAAIVVRNATLITKEEKQRIDRIVNLYRIGSMLLEQDDVDKLLFIFLTGLTHGKLLAFNRAMLFEYQPITKRLLGRMAIGPADTEDAKVIRRELEAKGDTLTIEACIRAFDEGRKSLNTNLNRTVANMVIDLERGDPCLDMALTGDKAFKEYEPVSFSLDLGHFLQKVKSEKVVLVGIPFSSGGYNFVFCDYIYDQHSFDQNTRELLPVFVGQMERALERIQSAATVKAAKETAWQEVSAMAAHRLGNILPLIDLRLQTAINRCIDPIQLEMLQLCTEDMQVAFHVVQDFKAFARAGVVNLAVLDSVDNIIEQVISPLRSSFGGIDIQLSRFNNKTAPRIRVDLNAMKDVFLNLLTNTKDVVEDGSVVRICTKTPSDANLQSCGLRLKGNFVKIVYKDNGPGIQSDDKERIFEAFFTGKPTNSGLGLAIARKFVEQHGGQIFEDGEYGGGARFNIVLPISI